MCAVMLPVRRPGSLSSNRHFLGIHNQEKRVAPQSLSSYRLAITMRVQ